MYLFKNTVNIIIRDGDNLSYEQYFKYNEIKIENDEIPSNEDFEYNNEAYMIYSTYKNLGQINDDELYVLNKFKILTNIEISTDNKFNNELTSTLNDLKDGILSVSETKQFIKNIIRAYKQ